MRRCYGYIRISPKIKDVDQRVKAFSAIFPDIQLISERGIHGCVPLEDRPQYQYLRAQLKSGDELVVWWIDELGRDFVTCCHEVTQLLQRGVVIKTLHQSLVFQQNDVVSASLLRMLQGYADAEKQRRLYAAEAGRCALKATPDQWKEKFRGRRRDDEKHQLIAQGLLEGKTLQAVAEETGVSLSTVKRVKTKLIDKDELGHMRTRNSCHPHEK